MNFKLRYNTIAVPYIKCFWITPNNPYFWMGYKISNYVKCVWKYPNNIIVRVWQYLVCQKWRCWWSWEGLGVVMGKPVYTRYCESDECVTHILSDVLVFIYTQSHFVLHVWSGNDSDEHQYPLLYQRWWTSHPTGNFKIFHMYLLIR